MVGSVVFPTRNKKRGRGRKKQAEKSRQFAIGWFPRRPLVQSRETILKSRGYRSTGWAPYTHELPELQSIRSRDCFSDCLGLDSKQRLPQTVEWEKANDCGLQRRICIYHRCVSNVDKDSGVGCALWRVLKKRSIGLDLVHYFRLKIYAQMLRFKR